MKRTKGWYIKERNNTQLEKPYYLVKGQLTKKQAEVMGESLYGYNTMLRFETKESYDKKIEELKNAGFTVNTF